MLLLLICPSFLPGLSPFTSYLLPLFTSTHPYLQEGGAYKGLLLVDGSSTEDVAGPQVEWDMLNHISQKLEVVNVADEIHTIHLREADKYVLRKRGEREASQ